MENRPATILYDNRRVLVNRREPDGRARDGTLWVHKDEVAPVNGFSVEQHGACRGDLCLPLPDDARRDDLFNLTAFARTTGQVVVAEPDAGVWSFGEMQALGGGLSHSRVAPDFEVPDRTGRPIRLSDFRGRKVLLVTWASW